MARPHGDEQVLLDDVAQRVVVEVDERRRHPSCERTDVVDRDVETTELVDDARDEGPHGVGIAQVGGGSDDARARTGHLGDRLGQRGGVLVGEHDVAPGGRQPARDAPTDADRGPGDQGPLPLQPEVDGHPAVSNVTAAAIGSDQSPLSDLSAVGAPP